MILPSAVSNWPYLIPTEAGGRGLRRGSLLARPLVRCDARGGSQLPINHNCFNSVNHVFGARGEAGWQAYEVVGIISIVKSGPATGRRKRATASGALVACLALIALDHTLALAQALTPDLFRPARDGFVLPQDSPLRRTSDNSSDDARLRREQGAAAPSRIGRIPTY